MFEDGMENLDFQSELYLYCRLIPWLRLGRGVGKNPGSRHIGSRILCNV